MLELINNSSRYHRSNCTDYNLLIIGIANVGKSSLINSLRRNHVKRGFYNLSNDLSVLVLYSNIYIIILLSLDV